MHDAVFCGLIEAHVDSEPEGFTGLDGGDGNFFHGCHVDVDEVHGFSAGDVGGVFEVVVVVEFVFGVVVEAEVIIEGGADEAVEEGFRGEGFEGCEGLDFEG